jgi:hypothetical protein
MAGEMPQGGEMPAEEGGGGEGAMGELVQNVGQGLSMIAELVGKAQDAPPEANCSKLDAGF